MNQSHEFQTNEVAVSQLPAMVLLAQMGWKPLTAKIANEYRRSRRSAVILEDVTRQYLRAQTIVRGEQTTKISEDNIDKLIYGLKDMPSDKIGPLAKDMWNRLVLPQSVEQSINGTRRALSARLIDFESPDNNIYHAVAEFDVECSHSTEKRRPDIVLFVNGIPLAVIECKKTDVDVQEGVTQTIRNQKPENIPNLYVYAQILLSLNKNNNRYGTTGTPAKLWCRWREGERDEQGQEHEQDRVQQRVRGIMDIRLADEDHQIIANELGLSTDAYAALTEHSRQITNQDCALAGLCHPHRLLHMMRNFILFSGPSKVIARFQQVDAVNKTLDRIKNNMNARPRG
ncbi:MAG: restriction endonuclease subunit R, partial [Proteobacteria bacterium]|nr:restriction endonuclease subunit R [Pseudomonadota bacterium]